MGGAVISRPSVRELNNKISQAKQYINSGNILIINPASIEADALELGYNIVEIKEIHIRYVNKISHEDYVGGRPPQRAYERKTKEF